MKKQIILTLLALCVSAAMVHAETEIAVDFNNSQLVISGNISPEAKIKEVSVNILKPGKTPADAAVGGLMDITEYSAQKPADEKGNFVINVPIAGASGNYMVYVDYEGNNEKSGKLVNFIRKEDNTDAIKALLNSKSPSEASKVMNDKWNLLNFKNDLYQALNKEGTAEIYYNLKEEKPIAEADITYEIAQKYFNIACNLQAVSEGKIGDISSCYEILGIDAEAKAAKYYDAGGDKMKAAAAEILKSRNVRSLMPFNGIFSEAVVLATIQYPNGVGNVKNVIKDFAGEIGITSVSDNSRIYSELAGNSYGTYAKLSEAYLAAKNSAESGGSASSGGSSGGGSGSSKGNGSVIGIPAAADKVENIDTEDKAIFDDLEDAAWAKEAVLNLYDKKIVSGMEERKFSPNEPLIREQFVTMIVNAFELKSNGGKAEFDDVSENDWFYNFVNTAFENDIIHGTGTGFGAGSELTREDMAVIIYNTLKKCGIELPTDNKKEKFADDDEISDYAKEAVNYLKDAGIVSGMGENKFNPKGINTRAQAAVVIYLVLKNGL